MRNIAVSCLSALVLLAARGAPAQPAALSEDTRFYLRAASCVVALERDALQLVARYRGGDRDVKPGLVKLTESGFAFIGRAYLRGLRKAEAEKLQADARAAQKEFSADALTELSTGCQAEGASLYADANGIEQVLVSNRAKARVEKLLAKKS